MTSVIEYIFEKYDEHIANSMAIILSDEDLASEMTEDFEEYLEVLSLEVADDTPEVTSEFEDDLPGGYSKALPGDGYRSHKHGYYD